MSPEEEISALRARIAELEFEVTDQSQNERFRLVVESAPNGILVANEAGEITLVNHQAEILFGYTREEFEGLRIEALIPARYRKGHVKTRAKFHKAPERRGMGLGRDLHAVRKDGKEFPVEIALTPLPSDSGMHVIASVVDITERKASEERLQFQSEILRNVHDAVFYVDQSGEICDWNEGACRVFGIESEDAIGRSIYEVCCASSGDPFHDRIIPAIQATGSAEVVIHCKRTDGADIYIRAKVRPMNREGTEGYVFCASDITNEKRLESELVRVSEQEQQRIGQDIHDDLCSQLSGIGCLTKVLEQKWSREDRSDSELVRKVTEMVADAGVRAREIARGLVPTVLETRGLTGAIRELVDRQKETFGIDCSASIADTDTVNKLDTEVAVQVYRVIQEAVNNAVKHSDADQISVEVAQIDESLEFVISDDGKGMPPDSTSGGMGLLTMQRRAEIIGGSFRIEASIGDGTRICLTLLLEDL